MLGLPGAITALLFDLDGVLTDTARVHFKAWKQMFEAHGYPFEQSDYDAYVDGKPREDGIRDFLASRDVRLSEDEITALGSEKNDLVLNLIKTQGVLAYDGSRAYLTAAREAGLRRALVSSSNNAQQVLEVTGLDKDIEVRVDGLVKTEQGLRGKPAPDTFLEAAKRLGVEPSQAAVFEDALAGVEAGRAGNFGFVIGVNRVNQADALKRHGADIVVNDLSELLR
jgi:beta-phosphoglucomutase family hydrolase